MTTKAENKITLKIETAKNNLMKSRK
uniref:Uncharacterized protein n=2 Tax=gambiae species complex TaxID=44542 RepID=A0A182IGV9_ANOAR